MSSGFISEAELAERRRVRQEEWQKVRKPDQPEEAPEEEYDHRSLFERLEEQKHKREIEYEEAHKLKNMIKGLDDDEVEFLDLVDRSKLEQERLKSLEEAREMRDFRDAVATLQERSLEDRINTEMRPRPQTHSASSRNSQTKLLAGAVVRKRPAQETTPTPEQKKPATGETPPAEGMSEVAAAARKRKARGDDDDDECSSSTVPGPAPAPAPGSGLRCIGILPGLGVYPDSSDSEQSSDTDADLASDAGSYDLLGRKVASVAAARKLAQATAKAASGR